MDTEIKLIWKALDEDVIQLCGRWKVYNQLFSSGKENVELLNRSGSYVFYQLQRLIIDNVFLALSRLIDPAKQGKNENASLHNLVTRINDTIPESHNLNLTTQLADLRTMCENIHLHRNQRIAHSDINRAFQDGAEWLPAVSYGEIEDALKLVREMMQDIALLLLDGHIDYDPEIVYGHDGDRLLHLLRKAHASGHSTNSAVEL